MTADVVPARPEGQAAVPPRPEARTSSGWAGGRIAAVVIGGLLVLLALALLGAGGVGLWADLSQRVGGYVTPGGHDFSTSGSALVTEETKLGSAGVGWLYPASLLGKIRIRVTPVGSTSPLFVGIGPSSDVERYLAGTNHTVITDYFSDKVRLVGGGPTRAAPGTKHFWVASTTGPGRRSLFWKAKDGSWTVVVMRADGRPGIAVHADLGAHLPALRWVAIGVSVAGLIFMAGGVLLIVGAIRRRPSSKE
jgi:hypothetical protein